MDKLIFNVNSNNQQGGLTAGQVNIGKQDRAVSTQIMETLRPILPKDKNKTVSINPIAQDGETLRFAKKMKDYLISLGYVNAIIPDTIIFEARKDWPGDANFFTDHNGELEMIYIVPQK